MGKFKILERSMGSGPSVSSGDVRGEFPLPIREIQRKVEESSDPIARFLQLGYLFEVILRYLAALALGLLFKTRKESKVDIPSRVLSSLQKPSFGHWSQVLHAILPRLPRQSLALIPEIESLNNPIERSSIIRKTFRTIQYQLGGKKGEDTPKRLSLTDFFDLFVAFRNRTKAHGAIQMDLARGMNALLESCAKSILQNLDFLSAYRLGFKCEDSSPKNSDGVFENEENEFERELVIVDLKGEPLFSLFPIVRVTGNNFWFLNGWKNANEVEYLCYHTGKIRTIYCEGISAFFEPDEVLLPGSSQRKVRLETVLRNVWEIDADAAIMAQDSNGVFGPVREATPSDSFQSDFTKIFGDLEGNKDLKNRGEVIVSRRPWCLARFLIEVIVYNIESEPITSQKTIEGTLALALAKLGELGVSHFAITPIGTEYGVPSISDFAKIFCVCWEKNRSCLDSISLVTVALNEKSQVKILEKNLQGIFFPERAE